MIQTTKTDSVLIVGFADDTQHPQRYFLLQRDTLPGESETELGLDQVHVEIDDQTQSHYGGVEAVKAVGTKLVFELNEDAARALRTNSKVVIKPQAGKLDLVELYLAIEKLIGEGIKVQTK